MEIETEKLNFSVKAFKVFESIQQINHKSLQKKQVHNFLMMEYSVEHMVGILGTEGYIIQGTKGHQLSMVTII